MDKSIAPLSADRIISALLNLREFIHRPTDEFNTIITSASRGNAWFTREEIGRALHALHHMLNKQDLKHWFRKIEISENPKVIGLILAGNIPLVGFHDVLCVLATGNIAQIKLSSSDEKLLPALLAELVKIEPALGSHIHFTDKLKGFDAIIATGSNNTSRYFEYYFGKVPNIIRKNRNSVAVLTGRETSIDILGLGHDIFDYFGLGCRNVSKIYIPNEYDIKDLFSPLEYFQPIINHFKYNNNYDYNRSIFLVNLIPHYDNGFVLLKEDKNLASPLAVIHYEKYHDLGNLEYRLENDIENIQCIVSDNDFRTELPTVRFGQSQHPKLWDYADNVNTLEFLMNL